MSSPSYINMCNEILLTALAPTAKYIYGDDVNAWRDKYYLSYIEHYVWFAQVWTKATILFDAYIYRLT